MGSSPDINYPAQPSYGEGMADALKAQVELLTGTGDFASTGSLESLLPLEESIRKKTAQTDTDILRQTLLGGTTGGGQQEVTYDDQGRIEIGREEAPSYKITQLAETLGTGGSYGPYDSTRANKGGLTKMTLQVVGPDNKVLDTVSKTFTGDDLKTELSNLSGLLEKQVQDNTDIPDDFKSTLTKNVTNSGFYQGTDPGQDVGGNFATGSKIFSAGEGAPIYAKDAEGNIIQDTSKAGTTEVTTIPTQRAEDGMVDLLGDRRNVQGQKQDFGEYVRNNPDILQQFQDTIRSGEDVSIEEFGQQHYQNFGKTEGREVPTSFGDLDRQAGFDESDNFLGLSALAEDLQAGNLSRQRERDLQDVARLSDTYQDIMEDYKPGTQEALESAREVLESQKDSLTGAGAIGGPKGLETGQIESKGFAAAQNTTPVNLTTDTTFEGATVADPTSLTADTSYTADTSVTGSGYTATAGLDGGQILQNDPVRAALMKDAEVALQQGLSDREQRQIAETARARSTLMGRTFDPKSMIEEAKAQVLEDNQRRMQNRAFAQRALGQEASFQESDLGRALQAGIQNQAAQNRAAEFTAGQDMQAQLANQQAANRASEFGVQAGLGQEQLQANLAQQKAMADAGFTQQARAAGLEAGLNQEQAEAQLNQQRLLANQQARQEAGKYGAQENMQAQLNNLANQISNYQFDTGAQMDADRLNEQLKQSGILGYIQAAGGLAALEDSSTLDPFQAILGRGGGGSLQAGQSVFGQAGYGLNSGPQYLNPESGLGYIQNQATNAASMYNAGLYSDATRDAGLLNLFGNIAGSGVGAAIGKFCWVAREVYGEHNPAWLLFRSWMLNESPSWLRKTYIKYGERFARFISNKPRLKARIRMWMDSKIGR
jgi:hypothetical protein